MSQHSTTDKSYDNEVCYTAGWMLLHYSKCCNLSNATCRLHMQPMINNTNSFTHHSGMIQQIVYLASYSGSSIWEGGKIATAKVHWYIHVLYVALM